MNKTKLLLPIAILLTVTLWSSAFVGIRFGLKGYTPGDVALLRYSVASIVMLIWYGSIKNRAQIHMRDIPYLLMMGIIGIGIYNIALNYGEVGITAGIASFIVGLMPVVTMILAIFFLQESVTKTVWIGVAICILGMSFIALSDHSHASKLSGFFEVFLATLSGATLSIMQKKILHRYKPIELTAFAVWGGTLLMLPFASSTIMHVTHAPIATTFAIIYMGIFPGAIAYACWSYTLSQLPASKAVLYLYCLPFVTTAMGYVFLGEKPTAAALTGGIIALLGALFVSLVKK